MGLFMAQPAIYDIGWRMHAIFMTSTSRIPLSIGLLVSKICQFDSDSYEQNQWVTNHLGQMCPLRARAKNRGLHGETVEV